MFRSAPSKFPGGAWVLKALPLKTALLAAALISMALALASVAPAMAQTTQPITETAQGTHTPASAGCQTGSTCSFYLEGSIAGTPINNSDSQLDDAGFTSTLTSYYPEGSLDGPTFSVPTEGHVTLRDAGGDIIQGVAEGTSTGNTDGTGPMVFTGTFIVTGGTGVYENATGFFNDTATTENGQFTANLDGTLDGVAVEPEPGPNECTITGTSGDDVLTGTAGRDVICGLGGSDTTRGFGGNDVIRSGSGNDTVRGSEGNDTLLGQDGSDSLQGNAGDDLMRGGAGSDTMQGGDGNDTMYGGTGRDSVRGNAGRDEVHGGPGDDTVTQN